MTKTLPSMPNLEHMRKEAKAILKAHNLADSACCDTLRNLHRFTDKSEQEIAAAEISLSEVQFALAIEYGFKTWKELSTEIGARSKSASHGIAQKGENLIRGYLHENRSELELEIMEATGANGIRWTPGENNGSRWMGMEFMRPGGKMLANWNSSWPKGVEPPSWDLMCRIRRGGNSWERVYIWAVAAEEELVSDCGSANEMDLKLISEMVDDAKSFFDVPFAANWIRGYYQHAIRLSVLGFLKANKSCGRLLFIYFCDAGGRQGEFLPSRHRWQESIVKMNSYLGITGRSVLERRVHSLFLPTQERG